ncbi:hypothetical protein [Cellulomonas sp. KRMCY2]|uniref:hypothetical protein n=1 Tax=Cellulomonas sp. KRMCY2 TaxID=1304865 RepID=UPI00045E9CF9|nr:hypothetical protein [Cellulomonas sp. KRMCY2]
MFTTTQAREPYASVPMLARSIDGIDGIDATTADPAVPCAARPSTGFVHLDGPCRCFFGGPAPEFAPLSDLAALPHAS